MPKLIESRRHIVMRIFSVIFFIFSTSVLCESILFGQSGLSELELSDFTKRAENRIKVFLDNIPVIADSRNSDVLRQAAVKNTLNLFTKDAFIQEQGKRSKRKRNWNPHAYLRELLRRSQNTPVLIDFKIIENLAPGKMKKRENEDGSITYSGKMKFEQYYCRLKSKYNHQEPIKKNPNINCDYYDYTDKEVKFELKVEKLITGDYWVIKIASITVERVYE